ncbi:MAG: hypothetical protein Tsb0027_02800 [Wenzhouxiangellaceae bacterium]
MPAIMNTEVQTISLFALTFMLLPVLLTLGIMWRWSLQTGNAIHALLRMLVQLLIIGYLLTFLFESDSAWLELAVLLVMVLASSWIALGTVPQLRWRLYRYALFAIVVGGGVTFALVILAVLRLEPWYRPQYSIPLAGMVFANAISVPRRHTGDSQSAPESAVQDAIRSEWLTLDKDCNVAMSNQARSLWACRNAFIRYVMALGNGKAIICEPCLAAKRVPNR